MGNVSKNREKDKYTTPISLEYISRKIVRTYLTDSLSYEWGEKSLRIGEKRYNSLIYSSSKKEIVKGVQRGLYKKQEENFDKFKNYYFGSKLRIVS